MVMVMVVVGKLRWNGENGTSGVEGVDRVWRKRYRGWIIDLVDFLDASFQE